MTLKEILNGRFPTDVVEALLKAYSEIEGNYALGKWKASELDAGHFVEATRRIIEQALFNSHTPIGKKLPDFSDAELKRYEQGSGDESFRILIPRTLKAVYNIRNKRGVGHLGVVSPNEMDATYILYTVKWVLAELVRLASGADLREIQAAVNSIVEVLVLLYEVVHAPGANNGVGSLYGSITHRKLGALHMLVQSIPRKRTITAG